MKRLLLPKEVAELLRISASQLCRLTKLGKIPAKDVGIGRNHAWRYDEDALTKWIAARPEPERPPRRRIRSSTSVQRGVTAPVKALENKNENGKAHRIAYPVNDLEQHA